MFTFVNKRTLTHEKFSRDKTIGITRHSHLTKITLFVILFKGISNIILYAFKHSYFRVHDREIRRDLQVLSVSTCEIVLTSTYFIQYIEYILFETISKYINMKCDKMNNSTENTAFDIQQNYIIFNI